MRFIYRAAVLLYVSIQFNDIVIVGVHDGGLAAGALLRDTVVVGQMNMTVHEQARVILVEQIVEALEPSVRNGLEIVQMAGGSVGQQDIEALVPLDGKPPSADTIYHLLFGIHILTVAVFIRAAEPEDPHAVDLDELVVRADAPCRYTLLVFVMIAVDIHQRTVRHRDEKLEIFDAQITAGDDQIKAVELAGTIVVVEVL